MTAPTALAIVEFKRLRVEENLSLRLIARRTGYALATVRKYLMGVHVDTATLVVDVNDAAYEPEASEVNPPEAAKELKPSPSRRDQLVYALELLAEGVPRTISEMFPDAPRSIKNSNKWVYRYITKLCKCGSIAPTGTNGSNGRALYGLVDPIENIEGFISSTFSAAMIDGPDAVSTSVEEVKEEETAIVEETDVELTAQTTVTIENILENNLVAIKDALEHFSARLDAIEQANEFTKSLLEQVAYGNREVVTKSENNFDALRKLILSSEPVITTQVVKVDNAQFAVELAKLTAAIGALAPTNNTDQLTDIIKCIDTLSKNVDSSAKSSSQRAETQRQALGAIKVLVENNQEINPTKEIETRLNKLEDVIACLASIIVDRDDVIAKPKVMPLSIVAEAK